MFIGQRGLAFHSIDQLWGKRYYITIERTRLWCSHVKNCKWNETIVKTKTNWKEVYNVSIPDMKLLKADDKNKSKEPGGLLLFFVLESQWGLQSTAKTLHLTPSLIRLLAPILLYVN